MTEGWNGDDYLVLFSAEEAQSASERYGVAALLPGHLIVGLHGWDDFIVQDENGDSFTLPTVPCDPKELVRFRVPDSNKLIPDNHVAGKVKWYITPIIFGGDPMARENLTWLPPAQHAEAVRWWNNLYRDLRAKRDPAP